MEQFLKESLLTIEQEFRSNELAYLALTTKVEQAIRDRWAFVLYRGLSGGVYVAREWKRTDLALLDGGSPKALIELKAMYTFDAALHKSDLHGFAAARSNDEGKALALAGLDTQVYTVLLATHPKRPVPETLEGIVKYRSGINRAFGCFASESSVRKNAVDAVCDELEGKDVVVAGALRGGSAFGIATDVLFWLVKA